MKTTILGPEQLSRIITQSPCMDLAEFLTSSASCWSYMVGPCARITLQDLADKISQSHDLTNVRTLIDYSLFKHLGSVVLQKKGDSFTLIYQ